MVNNGGKSLVVHHPQVLNKCVQWKKGKQELNNLWTSNSFITILVSNKSGIFFPPFKSSDYDFRGIECHKTLNHIILNLFLINLPSKMSTGYKYSFYIKYNLIE